MTKTEPPIETAIGLLKELRDTTPITAQRKRIDAFLAVNHDVQREISVVGQGINTCPYCKVYPSRIGGGCQICNTQPVPVSGEVSLEKCAESIQSVGLSDSEKVEAILRTVLVVAYNENDTPCIAESTLRHAALLITKIIDSHKLASYPPKRESGIDRWKLAKWLHDFETEVDSHGVHLRPWESRLQNIKDAYYSVAGECLEYITEIEDGESK